MTSDATITPTTTTQAYTISPQPVLSPTLTHATIASTSNTNNTAVQPSDAKVALSNPLPVIQTYDGAALQPNASSLTLQVPSIGTTLPLALVCQAQLGGAPLPIILPLMVTQANTSRAILPVSLPLMASQANTSRVTLPATIPPLTSQVQPVNLQLIAQQAAQMAVKQAVSQVLASPSQPQGLLPLPAAQHNFSQSASHTSSHSATVPNVYPPLLPEPTSHLQQQLRPYLQQPS